jgi:hypothetical protein
VAVEHQDVGSGFRFEFYEHGISFEWRFNIDDLKPRHGTLDATFSPGFQQQGQSNGLLAKNS